MKKTLTAMWGNQFLKGSALLTVASFVANVLNYFFNILSARGLGPAGFGEISALFSYTAVFSIPMLVMSLVIINKIGSKGKSSTHFAFSLQEWFFSKISRWWPIIIIILFISPFVPHITNLAPASGYALIPFVVLTFLLAFYSAVLQGLQLFFWVSVTGMTMSILKLIGPLLVIGGVDGLATVISFLLFSALIPLFVSYAVLKRSTSDHRHNTEKIEKRLIHAIFNKYVLATFLSILAITLFNNADVIFVKKYFDATSAGIYGSWSLFAKIIMYFAGPLSIVSFVFFSDKNTKKNHEKILSFTLALLLAIAVGSYIFYNYFSLTIIHLFFGRKFDSVAPYLGSASLFGSFYTTVSFINNYFLAKKSRLSLTLFVLMPVYFIMLLTIPKSLSNIIALNVYFSMAVVILYLVAYGWFIFYNGSDGKKKDGTLPQSYYPDL